MLIQKWNGYVKYRFYAEVVFYIVYFILFAIVMFLRRSYFDWLITQGCTHSTHLNNLITECECAYRDPTDSNRFVSSLAESSKSFAFICAF